MEDLEPILRKHPFFEDLEPEHLKLIVSCAKNLRFRPGEFLAREGQTEACMYLIRRGSVAIEANAPGGETTCIETLMPGDVMGISWVTPAKAHFDCRARDTVLAFSLDLACLRRKMDEDPALGYAITSRMLDRTYQRLSRLRLQQLDVYR
jgi:CRP/FNR family cyclic AMP-dependent transcriptional regulator